MKTNALIISLAVVAATATLAQAQTTGTASTKAATNQLSTTEKTWVDEMKNPAPWVSWGADLRIRNEYLNNTLTLNPRASLHEQDYFRFRGRLWTSITPADDFKFNARLATEPREWMKPAGYSPMRGHSGLDMTEGVVDNLNVQWKNILGHPANISVGRQDVFLGDGWLVGDGTPYDGSWTYFLDSARVSYEFKDIHTVVEAIGIIQDKRDNGWLPVINAGQERLLTEQNETGGILQVINSSIKEANVTGFFIYKGDQGTFNEPPFAASRSTIPGSDNADIYTLGGRVNGLVGDHWKYWVEGAYQMGEKQDRSIRNETQPSSPLAWRDIDAFGVNTKATYMFGDRFNNQLTFSYEFLSGDDPNSGNDEMFDVLWGRWPRWSEIGLYSFAAETRIGQEANMHRFGPSWTINPIKNMEFSASYYALFAQHSVPTRGASVGANGLFSGDGTFRGHFATAILKYKFNRFLSAHLWSEFLFPGDYYTHKDMLTFLRAEIYLTF